MSGCARSGRTPTWRPPWRPPRSGASRTPTLGAGETLADLRAASYDVEGLAGRSVGMEALDQLAMEHLLGVR